jgi:hypothetical protein
MSPLLIPKLLVTVVGAWFVLDSRRSDATVSQRRWDFARGLFLMALGVFLLVG